MNQIPLIVRFLKKNRMLFEPVPDNTKFMGNTVHDEKEP